MALFGKSAESIRFKVWKTRAGQLKGMSTEAMRTITGGSDAVVVTFFNSRHQECKTFFERTGIPFVEVTDGIPPGGRPSIYLLPAGKVNLHHKAALSTPSVLFHGMHPMPGRDGHVAEYFSNAKAKWCFASLEDPLFKAFGMENVATLMETLGMKDSECVEHKFVDKAITSAQGKLEAKVRNELPASSEEEWFQKNMQS
jgi:hypothetical protein